MSDEGDILDLFLDFADDPVGFNEIVLERGPYWHKQVQIAESFRDNAITVVPTGNGVGKSYVGSGLLIWALACHPFSRVLSTAPSNELLADVLWGEVRKAWNGSDLLSRLDIEIKSNPQRLEITDGWSAKGWSSDSIERMSGRHGDRLIWIIDEASGITDEVWEGIWSTNPWKILALGNPLYPEGGFYDLTRNPLANVVQISSLQSPDINKYESDYGLADGKWIERVRAQYGDGSPYWQAHVLGEFPESTFNALVHPNWLDLAENTPHSPKGPRTIAVDLATPTGKDRSCYVLRDENGVMLSELGNWTFEELARIISHLARQHGVPGSRIVYDAGGIGYGFGENLRAHGLTPIPYLGAGTGGELGVNARSACAHRLSRRLNPSRGGRDANALSIPADRRGDQDDFSIPPHIMKQIRPALLAMRLANEGTRVKLEEKRAVKTAIGHSPDALDALLMSFFVL